MRSVLLALGVLILWNGGWVWSVATTETREKFADESSSSPYKIVSHSSFGGGEKSCLKFVVLHRISHASILSMFLLLILFRF
jgi:hypothetical protein